MNCFLEIQKKKEEFRKLLTTVFAYTLGHYPGAAVGFMAVSEVGLPVDTSGLKLQTRFITCFA